MSVGRELGAIIPPSVAETTAEAIADRRLVAARPIGGSPVPSASREGADRPAIDPWADPHDGGLLRPPILGPLPPRDPE